jgi:multiple sugar transport system ATP-binding protein
VDGVSLDVADGELIGLVGPSGSGKSTLLRLVAGLECLGGGSIRFDGRVIDALPPRRRGVAMAFQSPALYPHLSVRENLAFPLRMRKFPPADIGKRVAATSEPLRLATLLDRWPAQLSGGERQRVALGRALARDARCLLLDEPFAHLDTQLREQVRLDLLEMHRRRPTTTLCVTHDQHDALLLGHRVAVLAAGKLQQVGPPLEIYDSPANRFVAGFFGTPAMHFLNGRLEADNENLCFVAGTIRLRVPNSAAAKLRDRTGASVVLGLRPEAIQLANTNETDGQTIRATVRVSEVLGDRVFHRVETADGQMLMVGGTRQAPSLSEVPHTFRADPTGMQFFAPGPFGERL